MAIVLLGQNMLSWNAKDQSRFWTMSGYLQWFTGTSTVLCGGLTEIEAHADTVGVQKFLSSLQLKNSVVARVCDSAIGFVESAAIGYFEGDLKNVGTVQRAETGRVYLKKTIYSDITVEADIDDGKRSNWETTLPVDVYVDSRVFLYVVLTFTKPSESDVAQVMAFGFIHNNYKDTDRRVIMMSRMDQIAGKLMERCKAHASMDSLNFVVMGGDFNAPPDRRDTKTLTYLYQGCAEFFGGTTITSRKAAGDKVSLYDYWMTTYDPDKDTGDKAPFNWVKSAVPSWKAEASAYTTYPYVDDKSKSHPNLSDHAAVMLTIA